MKMPEEAKNLFENGVVYFATSHDDKPNVTVTQSGIVIGDDRLLICDCEMKLAKDNILVNGDCAIAVWDVAKEIGFKAFGQACYYDSGEYLELAKKRLEGESYKPKGAVVITLESVYQIA